MPNPKKPAFRLRDIQAFNPEAPKPDAPPPPAPDDVEQRLRELQYEAEGISSVALRAADALKSARAELQYVIAERDKTFATMLADAEAAETRVRELGQNAKQDAKHIKKQGELYDSALRQNALLSQNCKAAEAREKRLREAIERYLTAKHDLRQAGKQDEHEPYQAALIEYDKAEQGLSAALAQGGTDDQAG